MFDPHKGSSMVKNVQCILYNKSEDAVRDFDVKIAILGEASTGLPALPQASLTKLLESFFRHTNKILYDLIQVIASSSLANVESSYFHNVTFLTNLKHFSFEVTPLFSLP